MRVTPSHVPPPTRSLPARMSGLSSQKYASFVGLVRQAIQDFYEAGDLVRYLHHLTAM